MKRFTASLLVLLGAASFGVLSTILKLGYQHGFSAADITGSQVVFGVLGLWLLSLPTLPRLRKLSWPAWRALLLCGLFPGLTGIFYYLSLQTISASLGVVLLFQFVWMGMLLDWLIQRRPPRLQQWCALVLVLIGTVLAAGYQTLFEKHIDALGITFGLLAALSYACNLQASGRVAIEVPSVLRSTLMMTGALIVTLGVFPPHFLVNGSLSQGLWFWAILMGLFGVIIPPYLFAKAIPETGPTLATILGSVELPVVIICSALVLHEPVDVVQWVGVGLILLGIVVSERRGSST